MNILFTNAGRRTYMIEFAMELKKCNQSINIWICDTNEDTAAFYVDPSSNKFITPHVSRNEGKYIEALFKYVKENKIDIIIPLMDFELPVLSKNRDLFYSIGAYVMVSSSELIDKTLNKELNTIFLKSNKLPFPNTYFNYEDIPQGIKIVRKKIFGSGSIGLSFHKDKSNLTDFIKGEDMAQEKIEGEEYNIDILNDLNGNFVHATVKKKLLMRAGETDKATVIFDDELFSFAKKISNATKHIGNLDVDIMRDAYERVYIIDMNPRFGGGYPFSHVAGFNYLEAIIRMVRKQTISFPQIEEGITAMKGISIYTKP